MVKQRFSLRWLTPFLILIHTMNGCKSGGKADDDSDTESTRGQPAISQEENVIQFDFGEKGTAALIFPEEEGFLTPEEVSVEFLTAGPEVENLAALGENPLGGIFKLEAAADFEGYVDFQIDLSGLPEGAEASEYSVVHLVEDQSHWEVVPLIKLEGSKLHVSLSHFSMYALIKPDTRLMYVSLKNPIVFNKDTDTTNEICLEITRVPYLVACPRSSDHRIGKT